MIFFYHAQLNEHSTNLSDSESKHAIKSRRLNKGQEFRILNGKGLIAHATVDSTDNGILSFSIGKIDLQLPSEPKLHIAISPLKQNDRFEWFVEKATEFGVYEITPILCHRTERLRFKRERIERIMISALKQSGNPNLPLFNEAIEFTDFLKKIPDGIKLIAHCESLDKRSLNEMDFVQNTVVLIGPEGDFRKDEIELAKNSGFDALDLGPLTLRTETAGIKICSYFQTQKQS